MNLKSHSVSQQLGLVAESVHDKRPSVPTGYMGLDSMLRRGGLLPGTLAILGGRTGTRKSTIVANMMVQMVTAGYSVALAGMDEQPWQYVVSLMSVVSGRSRDWVEEVWDSPMGEQLQRDWRELRGKLHLFTGRKPGIPDIEAQMELVSMEGTKPQVVFIDYLNKMTRDREYGWDETKRIPRLVEHLGEWSTATGTIVVALHQLSRNDEFGGVNQRNAGHIPVTLAQLKYGGEEDADIVFGTYRPANDPLGNMAKDVAETTLGDRYDEDAHENAIARVRRFKNSTFLQLLKNRPGTHTEERGIELKSLHGESLLMQEAEAEEPEDEAAEEAPRAQVVES